MIDRLLLFSLSILIGLASAASAAELPGTVQHLSGEARSPNTGVLLYTENHEKRLNLDGSVEIESVFRDSAGAIIATRSVKLSADGFLPSYHFRDERTGMKRASDSKAMVP